MEMTVPCSVVSKELDGTRVKLNVNPGSTGPRLVIMGLGAPGDLIFAVGKRYHVTIEEAEEAEEEAERELAESAAPA